MDSSPKRDAGSPKATPNHQAGPINEQPQHNEGPTPSTSSFSLPAVTDTPSSRTRSGNVKEFQSLHRWEAQGHLPGGGTIPPRQTSFVSRPSASSSDISALLSTAPSLSHFVSSFDKRTLKSLGECKQNKDMSSRNRPRSGQPRDGGLDAHEEINMWNQIVANLTKVNSVNEKQKELGKQIKEMEEGIADRGGTKTTAEIDSLSTLYREVMKLAEEEQQMLHEEPFDIIKNIEILTALKKASEEPQSRQTQVSKSRNQKKRVEDEPLAVAESPGPSPGVPAEKMNRIKGSSARSQSMPREPKEPGPKVGEELKSDPFAVGAEVVYKHNKKNGMEGEGYLYTIKAVHGEGPKKRFDVQDLDPDSDEKDATYRAKPDQLIPIPTEGSILPTFIIGKQVLARYPDTTTFYKAEITSVKKDVYRLRFEGEDEDDKQMEVDRRFVLDDVGK